MVREGEQVEEMRYVEEKGIPKVCKLGRKNLLAFVWPADVDANEVFVRGQQDTLRSLHVDFIPA